MPHLEPRREGHALDQPEGLDGPDDARALGGIDDHAPPDEGAGRRLHLPTLLLGVGLPLGPLGVHPLRVALVRGARAHAEHAENGHRAHRQLPGRAEHAARVLARLGLLTDGGRRVARRRAEQPEQGREIRTPEADLRRVGAHAGSGRTAIPEVS